MHIARVTLICLVAFAFIAGCGMMSKKAETPEATTTATGATQMTESAEMESNAGTAMEETAIEEITLNVTGMT